MEKQNGSLMVSNKASHGGGMQMDWFGGFNTYMNKWTAGALLLWWQNPAE